MTNETDEQDAQVVATYGRRLELSLGGQERVPARVKGRRLRPVCGDRVTASRIAAEDEWLITSVRPRDNELTRPDLRGRTEVLAANVTVLVIVASPLPRPDWYIVDRYLCAAELMGVKAIVVYNKTDLEQAGDERPALDDYARIGYPVVVTSAETGDGLERLRALLHGETAIFVGQSGVGKSTLINQLSAAAEHRTADISRKTGEGKHTTVNSVLRRLEGGGAVIDSPGVRDYAPAIDAADRVVAGFREIEQTGHNCKYSNCRHLREPGCAVKSSVESGEISPRRYESYRRLLRLTESFIDRH
jgi:ribosome biogenesis GTPase